MWIRSTGLGKGNELTAKFEALKDVEGCWILSMRTTEPVKWHVRVAMTKSDFKDMLKLMIKDGTLFRVLKDFLFGTENNKPPKDY